MDPFIGEIRLFAGNFPPRNWAFCNGQLLAISSNSALFSILGTIYGGDGRTTFALPDLRGRVAIHPGSGPGLTPRNEGQKLGSETNTLNVSQMPSHNHTVAASSTRGTSADPKDLILAGDPDNPYIAPGRADEQMAATMIGNNGGGQAVNNMQPSLGLNYIIALVGVFPSRN